MQNTIPGAISEHANFRIFLRRRSGYPPCRPPTRRAVMKLSCLQQLWCIWVFLLINLSNCSLTTTSVLGPALANFFCTRFENLEFYWVNVFFRITENYRSWWELRVTAREFGLTPWSSTAKIIAKDGMSYTVFISVYYYIRLNYRIV